MRGNDPYDLLISGDQEQNPGKLLYKEKGKIRYIFWDVLIYIVFYFIISHYIEVDSNMHWAYIVILLIGLVFAIFKIRKHINTWHSKIEIYENYIVAYGYEAFFNIDGMVVYPRTLKKEKWGKSVCYGYGYYGNDIFIVFPKFSDSDAIVVLDKMDNNKIIEMLEYIGIKQFDGYYRR